LSTHQNSVEKAGLASKTTPNTTLEADIKRISEFSQKILVRKEKIQRNKRLYGSKCNKSTLAPGLGIKGLFIHAYSSRLFLEPKNILSRPEY
jgi:hypothetical protein